MNNVIGYLGNEWERKAHWNAMRSYKGCWDLFRNEKDEWEKNIANVHKEMYNTHLNHYIGRAS